MSPQVLVIVEGSDPNALRVHAILWLRFSINKIILVGISRLFQCLLAIRSRPFAGLVVIATSWRLLFWLGRSILVELALYLGSGSCKVEMHPRLNGRSWVGFRYLRIGIGL